MTLTDFAVAVLAFCNATGGSVTSWVRSPGHNADVGGVDSSYHLLGLAVDVVYRNPDSYTLRQGRERLASRLGLWCLFEEDHDHLQPLEN